MLNGIVSARAATNPTPRILGQLDTLMRSLRATKESRAAEIAAEYRRTVNDEYAGGHCRSYGLPRKWRIVSMNLPTEIGLER